MNDAGFTFCSLDLIFICTLLSRFSFWFLWSILEFDFSKQNTKSKNGFQFSSSAYIYSHIHITSPSIDLCTWFHLQGNYITTTPTCQAQFTRKFICLRVDLSICQSNHRYQPYSVKPTSAHISNKQQTKNGNPHLHTASQSNISNPMPINAVLGFAVTYT